mgnify:CR=1 FL=1
MVDHKSNWALPPAVLLVKSMSLATVMPAPLNRRKALAAVVLVKVILPEPVTLLLPKAKVVAAEEKRVSAAICNALPMGKVARVDMQ